MSDWREWVQCVLTGYAEKCTDGTPSEKAEEARMTWCGRQKTGFEFMDASHAALNARNGGRLVACTECVEAICKTLREHGT